MIVPIARRAAPGSNPTAGEGAGDPLVLLRDCHARIRRFGALAVRLAEPDVIAAEAAEAAAAVHRYFTVALPLHVADEERSLLPRLEARGADLPLRGALAEMSRQHVDIEAGIDALAPTWIAIAEGADDAVRLASRPPAEALAVLLEAHLQLEEATIFPAIPALLTDADRAALVDEMRARRALPVPPA